MKKSDKATITDVAEHFGCSITTISRAINGAPDINAETRRKILEYAEEIGFVSRRATSLKGRVGVIVDGEERPPFYREIIASFREAATKQRFSVSELTLGSLSLSAVYEKRKLQGLFLLGLKYNSPLYLQVKALSRPAVLLNSGVSDNRFVSCVKSNDVLAISDAVDYLVSLGHTHIAFVGNKDEALLSAEQLAGYTFGLEKNCIPYRYDLTYSDENSVRGGRAAAESFMMYRRYFTAAICVSEQMALGFADQLNQMGLRIPEDCSIITCADVTAEDEPRLFTSILRNCTELGKRAFDALRLTIVGFGSVEPTISCKLADLEKTCAPKPTPRRPGF